MNELLSALAIAACVYYVCSLVCSVVLIRHYRPDLTWALRDVIGVVSLCWILVPALAVGKWTGRSMDEMFNEILSSRSAMQKIAMRKKMRQWEKEEEQFNQFNVKQRKKKKTKE